jgi:hypothetical protein
MRQVGGASWTHVHDIPNACTARRRKCVRLWLTWARNEGGTIRADQSTSRGIRTSLARVCCHDIINFCEYYRTNGLGSQGVRGGDGRKKTLQVSPADSRLDWQNTPT